MLKEKNYLLAVFCVLFIVEMISMTRNFQKFSVCFQRVNDIYLCENKIDDEIIVFEEETDFEFLNEALESLNKEYKGYRILSYAGISFERKLTEIESEISQLKSIINSQ